MFGTTIVQTTYLDVEIENITKVFGITWPNVIWRDMRKPLYSALGARLYMTYSSKREAIPRAVSDQAAYWVNHYRPHGNRDKFIDDAEMLDEGVAYCEAFHFIYSFFKICCPY